MQSMSLANAWRGKLPEPEHLLYSRLPITKQKLAITRVIAMNEYQDGVPARKIYPDLGISAARFYTLVKAWQKRKSLKSVVPYADAKSRQKRSKLHPGVAWLIRECVRECAESAEHISEKSLMKRIQERARRRRLPVPSSETLSRHIAKSTLSDRTTSQAPVARATGTGPGNVFGAHLIIDDTAVELITTAGNGLLKPTLTLIFDDVSRLILGSHISATRPHPSSVAQALIDAQRRYADLKQEGLRAIDGLTPHLSGRFPATDAGSELASILQDAGARFWDIRRVSSESYRGYGRLIRRSMITKIGDLSLKPSVTASEPADRVSETGASSFSPMEWRDAHKIIQEAIAAHNRSRLPIAIALSQNPDGKQDAPKINDGDVDSIERLFTTFHSHWSRSDRC